MVFIFFQTLSCLQRHLEILSAEKEDKKSEAASTSKLVREQFVESVTDVMENELQCAVCSELFITVFLIFHLCILLLVTVTEQNET